MSGHLIAGRYRLETVLGRGGMATVWRGIDERLGRNVAVKLLDRVDTADPGAIERFDREARTAAGLSHPNIVAVHDQGYDDGVSYLVMELVDGPSLATLVDRGPLPIAEAARVAGQVCDALAAAHAAGVVHRDIKPANILLTPTGTVKVCDFGIARLAHQQQKHLTAPATAVGTGTYMAPEQATGGQVDARADLYALGCVLYAMLTGTPPFDGENPLAVVWQHQHQSPPPVTSRRPDTPAALDALIARLLAKDPAERPDPARLREVLAPYAGPSATTAPAEAGPAAVRPGRARVAVVSPTQTMPALRYDDAQPPAAGERFRLGPAGIAAVAVSAVILAAVIVAALLASRPSGGPDAHPATSTTPPSVAATAPTDTPENDPAKGVAALRATIEQQVQAGELDAKAARDLTSRLNEVERALNKNQPDKAAGTLADLRSKIRDLRGDGYKISSSAYDALVASVDQLADTLPPTGTGNGNRDGG